jgi:hypothetical protein
MLYNNTECFIQRDRDTKGLKQCRGWQSSSYNEKKYQDTNSGFSLKNYNFIFKYFTV